LGGQVIHSQALLSAQPDSTTKIGAFTLCQPEGEGILLLCDDRLDHTAQWENQYVAEVQQTDHYNTGLVPTQFSVQPILQNRIMKM
jgi:hypothetical protein